VPPPGYLEGLRALCDEFGIVWIADEVMAGFGRTGQWFAWQNWGAQPDLICFAKGVNSGYVPLGGVVISSAIAQAYDAKMFPGGLTYSGHPVACATAVASINIFDEEDVLAHARHLGDDIIGPALRDIAERHPAVGEVRGLGVFWAVELVPIRPLVSLLPRRRSPPSSPSASETACGRCRPATASTWCRRATPPTISHARASPSSTQPSPSPTRHVLTRSREQLRLQGA
jgi:taurine---2-oxoglutarate transaminase